MPPSQTPSSQSQQPSFQEPTIQPASPEKAHERSSSQSSTSEDSQTVIIDPPSSLETSTHPSSSKEAQTDPQAQPSSSNEEPRKCWICFSDETEDTPLSSEWVSPCPCALKAHQSCLLDWIADLESPKRKKAKKVQCPQCKSDIRILQPHSLSIELVRAIQRITGNLIWPAAATAIGGMVTAGLFGHGVATLWFLLEQHEFDRFVFPRGGFMPLRRCLGMPLIPILLIASRTSAGDSVLPLAPLLYYGTHKSADTRLAYPWSLALWVSALPLIRSLYFGAYRRYALPYEKAWLQEIQPRVVENSEDSGAQTEQEGLDEDGGDNGGPLDVDFELGVQIEVEAVDEDGAEQHHHHHGHQHDHDDQDLPQPNNQPGQDQAAINIQGDDQDDNQNANNQEGDQNQNQGAQLQLRPEPRPLRQPIIQRFFVAIPDFARLSMGALVFPVVSFYMGQILKVTLPKTWIKPPKYWDPWSKGVLQSRFGRTLFGGCLFVVLKDTLFLYSKYSMAHNHRKRKVLNYDEIKKPWYQKNIDELIAWE